MLAPTPLPDPTEIPVLLVDENTPATPPPVEIPKIENAELPVVVPWIASLIPPDVLP